MTSFNTDKCNAFNNMFEDCNGLTVYLTSEHNSKLIKNIPEYVTVNITDELFN